MPYKGSRWLGWLGHNSQGPMGSLPTTSGILVLMVSGTSPEFWTGLSTDTIPNLWNKAKITAILKAGKPLTEPKSYCPISLLCVPSKILEKLILDRITEDVPLSDTQRKFHPRHTNTSLFCGIIQRTKEGMNAAKLADRTLAAAVDTSKAFDTIPQYGLITKLMDTAFHPNNIKWLGNVLVGIMSLLNSEAWSPKSPPAQGSLLPSHPV